jgi:hypothetical protein
MEYSSHQQVWVFVAVARGVNGDDELFAGTVDQAGQAPLIAEPADVVPDLEEREPRVDLEFTLVVKLTAALVVDEFDELRVHG